MPYERSKNQIRKRLMSPKSCAPGSFRTKPVGKHGKQIVVCCPAGKWSRRAQRCKVGMKAQSLRTPR
jgi:hypothetical protein